ncbi:MAG TPA: acyl-CoA thioesterase [Candidatus Saccharimonadales bacterium]|nr:acyl-CoA thioesterase [Candidatus Saccharimonadales bacterium]
MHSTETSYVVRLRFGSDAKLRRRFMVTDEDVPSNLRFGLLLERLDKLAEETALRYVRRTFPEARVVTAAMDSLLVRAMPDINRDMVMRARINLVGRSSMEVGVRIEQPGEPLLHIGSSYFTMVGRVRENDEEKSVPLPPLEYKSKMEQLRRDRGLARRERYRAAVNLAAEPPSREEYEMLRRLHEAQEQPGTKLLLASRQVTEGWERTYPEYENVPKKIFGGWVAHRAYTYAHICAERLASHRMLLASVDRINFYHPVRMGDKLHFVSRVTYTGNTSVSVETEITRISRDRKETALSNVCAFTFIHMGRQMERLPVQQLYPTTYAEDARYLAGYRRRKAYLEWKEQTKGK